jgi:hypothetical protein
MDDMRAVTGQVETWPKAKPKSRDRLMIALVAFGVVLTVLWTGAIAYGLGWLAWYLLR